MKTFLHVARQPSVRNRALRVALVVGTVFFTINYADKLLAGTLTHSELIKAMVSYCVPFCVSTYSSVLAIMERDSV
ncbi:nitrate/nitrite transporter NrtS [Falsiruegeria mediterranea]|uniref:nitrate/nitrite transporter NrtS n=1 Tax=Falsiruegeria mediterranea TaxID=1280832 RepID=UPI0015F279A7|nr:nitrate/nitrite transporter NrtS [Falsiruegeria mediterranea]